MRERSDLWRRFDSAWLDLVLVAVLLFTPVVSLGLDLQRDTFLDIALILPLVLRRKAPVVMFTAICLILLWQSVTLDSPRYGDVAFLFALYAIAAYGPRWAVWGGLGAGLLGAVIASISWNAASLSDPSSTVTAFIMLGAVVFASWLLGYLARTRRAYVAGLEERADQLERDAAQQAQIATAAERARIAREMHDVVAHSLSVMVVQADGALYAAEKRPEIAAETLRTISTTGRSSLVEMRKLLGLLRDDDNTVSLAPMPGSDDIPGLIEQLRASGLAIELHVLGDLARLDSATGLTAYRIVQEALTNTLKHAGPGVSATVDLRVTKDSVRIRVDDDGRGSTATDDGQGHGLVGVRERIAVHAGTVEAGPRPGGGFRVQAVVPLVAA